MQNSKSSSVGSQIDAQVFWLKYQKEIAGLVVLVLIAALAFAGYRFYQQHRNDEAAALLSSAKTEQDYQNIFASYPGTPSAASAYLLLAEKQQKAGQRADANTTLRIFLEKFPNHEFVSTARMAIASNMEALGKTDEALTFYQEIASANPPSFNSPSAMLAQAKLFHGQKKDDEARKICETLMTQFRESFAALEASQLLRELAPAKVEAPVTSPPPLLSAPAGSASPRP